MKRINKGRIISSVAGDYTVSDGFGELVTCKARGVFRARGISPCVGDFVTLSSDERGEYIIDSIEERKNSLIRPPLANLDSCIIVVSSCEPKPNALVIDRLTVIFEKKGIESIMVFTKLDKKEPKVFDIYKNAGFRCFCISPDDISGIDEIKIHLSGKTSALIGNTGVGKTTLLNLLTGDSRPTGEISRKLGRGRHTTRTVEMVEASGGYVIDTPGFSTVQTRFYGELLSSEVAECFREFSPRLGKCRFKGCTHNGEDGCGICKAVDDGEISPNRYESFKAIYKEAKLAENDYS